MARTVRYESRPGARDGDDYATRLAKFVPAEIVSLFLTAWPMLVTESVKTTQKTGGGTLSAGDPTPSQVLELKPIVDPLVFFAIVGGLALAQWLYLWVVPKGGEPRPRPWMYPLSTLALLAWISGCTAALQVFVKPAPHPSTGKLIVLFAAFLIPLLDLGLEKCFPARLAIAERSRTGP